MARLSLSGRQRFFSERRILHADVKRVYYYFKSEAQLEVTIFLQRGVAWMIQRWGFGLEGSLYFSRYMISMGVSCFTDCCRLCYAMLLDT